MFVLFHAGLDNGLPDPIHCPPHRLAKMLDNFPDLIVIAAHMGSYRMWDEVRDTLCGRDLYFDTSFAHKHLGNAGMVALIKEHGIDKILFGSDLPWDDQTGQVAMIHKLSLTREDRGKILYHNAQDVLGLS